MPHLPDRPDLDQLRRRARELHRAAAGGDARSLRRLQSVSEKVTLSVAQLVIAREYGFASWPQLKAEAERRRAASHADRAAPLPADLPAALPADLERFGYPDFLTAEEDDLITGQYADRPQLRAVLEGVLAVLPVLGPVTVQARKTCVCLISPRRTFAVVQATTKSRVDLGLRLDGLEPAGRLQAARSFRGGSATVRIALSGPGDVDKDVLGWLQRAYDENTAPPAPRRPARRPAPEIGQLTVLIEGFDLPGLICQPEPGGPGHQDIHVAVYSHSKDRPALVMPGNPWLATEPVPGDSPSARWEVPVAVRRGDAGLDFGGPFVRGDRTDRHLGLAWGDVPGDGTLRLFRGAKLRLADVDPGLIEDAMRLGRRLVARIRLTDAKGHPICARVRSPDVVWSAELAESTP